jgi:ubiquinone biosynthesis protein UbiJ
VAFFFAMLLETPVAAALRRLLETERWARERLAPFAGDTVELRAPPLPALRFGIMPGGGLEPAGAGGEAEVTITIGPAALAALPRGAQEVVDAVEVSGQPALAAEARVLLRHLRWDFEEDLARLLGDVAAHRIAGAARDFVAWQADSARRLAESLAAYAAHEKHLVVRREELQELARAVALLEAGIERLEQRVRDLG